MSRRARVAFMLFEGATVGVQLGLLTYASDVLFVLAMLMLCLVVAWRAIGRTYDRAYEDGCRDTARFTAVLHETMKGPK